jgi:hypothetical protein
MNKSTHPTQLDEQEYVYALNANLESLGGDTYSITNEHSNLLANKFKSGFRVVGLKNDINLNKTFFFLKNIITEVSEFGCIENTSSILEVPDLTVDIVSENLLAPPLEGTVQVPHQTYTTLLSDCVSNLCFNLSLNYPIKKIEIKNEKNNSIIVFTDNFNPPRYIQLNSLDIYSYTGEEVCLDTSSVESTCLACNKMKIFKDFSIPELKPESVTLGGRLRMGTYQFLVAYSDSIGNEISEYYSVTNTIRIFDQSNSTLEQQNLADRTNLSIKLSIEGLDKNYTHYKVAVIQIADINNAVSYFVEGVHPINDNSIIYSGEDNKDRISYTALIRQNLFVKKWEGLTQSSNYLFGYGIEMEKEVNLQPVVNLLGQFIKWQSSIAPEDLYEDGVSSALYQGYNREEVVPIGIRFYGEEGYKTSIFPLIGRQPTIRPLSDISTETKYDYDVVLAGNKDYDSISGGTQSCTTNERTQRWQIYNDSNVEGLCPATEGIETRTVSEEEERSCKLPLTPDFPGSFVIDNFSDYTNLTNFIEDNKESCQGGDSGIFGSSALCETFNNTFPEQECGDDLFGVGCTDAVLVGTPEIEVVPGSITGENFAGVELIFPEDYPRLKEPSQCNIYRSGENGGIVRDENFELSYMIKANELPLLRQYTMAVREFNFSNDTCQTSDDIQLVSGNAAPAQGYFNNYFGDDSIVGLQTDKNAAIGSILNPTWTNKIHKGGLWFKATLDGRQSIILQLSKLRSVFDKDDNTRPGLNPKQEIRISIFNRCNSQTAIFSDIIPVVNRGSQYKISLTSSGVSIDRGDGTAPYNHIEDSMFPGGSFYVVVDNPIYIETGIRFNSELGDIEPNQYVTKYRTVPTDGCYAIAFREIGFSSATISWTGIKFIKKSTYTSICTYQQPVIQKCKAIPFKYGNFAYHESSDNYPDNKELYDSSKLIIGQNTFSGQLKQDFEKYFVSGTASGDVYTLNQETNFACKPIRHFKLPSNKVSPFMANNRQQPFSASTIYPIGFTLDENIINSLLDIAVSNELITSQRRNSLVKYEIVRGDISNDRSIQSSGLLFDIREYEDKGKSILYPNYPFNDLGADKLNLGASQDAIEQNSKFTFHSPETDYYKSTLPSEMSIQGFMFGKSKGTIDEVKDHPKWTILSPKARSLAGTLAGLEVAAEIAISAAQAFSNFNPIAGFSNTVFPGGAIGAATILAFQTASGIVFKYGRYRYEWLKIFRDLGQPQNFASYYYAEGNYNYLKPAQGDEHNIRALTVAKKLKQKMSIIVDETSGERITVNNIDREESVFLSTGNAFPIVYDEELEYKNYDNNAVNNATSSLTFASENNQCVVGKSADIIRNIASPYVYLKNYIPAQYGVISSVKWLPTGHTGDLRNPKSSCVSIFGGDTFITRHTLKRKLPIFLIDSMRQASLTPFNYSFYSNIGRDPKFYVNYEMNKDFDRKSTLLPDIDSDFNMDCYTRGGNYITQPSKFYLYYYGVPSFLCETRINTSYRYGKEGLSKSFYPDVGDIGDWTQETNVPLKTPNYFFYNDVYSRANSGFSFRTLPDNYSKELFDVAYDKPNGVMYSLPDNEENNLNEPWLIYRPFDFYEFPTKYGKLKDLKGIEGGQVLARFENQTAIFNSVEVTVETGQKVENNNMGAGFSRRPVTFIETDLGYLGTQTTQLVSSEAGHFFADAKRGQFFKIQPGGKGIEEISSNSGGKPTGMSHWFKQQLPFKILNKIPNADVDNAMNGVGLTMGWDSRFKRVFLTKKDYIPKSNCIEFIEGVGYVYNQTKCEDTIKDPECPLGYTYNANTLNCEKTTFSKSCPPGFSYNSATSLCENTASITACPVGYTYDSLKNNCKKITTVTVGQVPTITATPSAFSIGSGDTVSIELTSDVPGTTFSWTVSQTNVTGAISGSGNTITDTLTSTVLGSVVYTVTGTSPEGCTNTITTIVSVTSVQVIDENTQINIWFDSSGSMDQTLVPLQVMRDTVLRDSLVEAFPNTVDGNAKYNSLVKVIDFSTERHINRLAQVFPNNNTVTKIINLTFADESDAYGVGAALAIYSNQVTPQVRADITLLKNNLVGNMPLYGVGFHVATGGVASPQYPAFRTMVKKIHFSEAPFHGEATMPNGGNSIPDGPVFGLTSIERTKVSLVRDVVPASTPVYYADLIKCALKTLGFDFTITC